MMAKIAAALLSVFPLLAQGSAAKPCRAEALKEDCAETRAQCQRLAKRGEAGAQNYVGTMHVQGIGVEEDEAEAEKWYKKAAEQGQSFAREALRGMGKAPQNP
jgi:TPR repeat protein